MLHHLSEYVLNMHRCYANYFDEHYNINYTDKIYPQFFGPVQLKLFWNDIVPFLKYTSMYYVWSMYTFKN